MKNLQNFYDSGKQGSQSSLHHDRTFDVSFKHYKMKDWVNAAFGGNSEKMELFEPLFQINFHKDLREKN